MGRSPDLCKLVKMAQVIEHKVIFEMKDVQVGIGKIVNGGHNEGLLSLGHVFIKALKVDCALE